MNYKETLDWMFTQLPMFQRKGQAAYKANLNNTLALDKHFEYPHNSFKSIHIAGTNGKGSVSHIIASCLQEAGYKVGLYTSPHLKDFRERIKINGAPIDKKLVVSFINNNRDIFEELKPSFFEMTVAMAFKYFNEKKVDYAVIETGLGGRLDSTNIITPEISIITNISLDHVALLGDTLQKIAIEKAGIIKKGIPVIIGEYDAEVASVFDFRAKKEEASLIYANKEYSVSNSLFNVDYRQLDIQEGGKVLYDNIQSSLTGKYQNKNIITAIASLEKLKEKGINISNKSIYRGFRNIVSNTGIMGRWQILQRNPIVVCDTGHNEAGIRNVLEQLDEMKYDILHVVFGMVSDKSIDTVLSLLPKNAKYYFTKASIPRAMNEEELCNMAKLYNLYGKTYKTVSSAVEAAKKEACKDDLIYIGGSTFVVAEVV